MISSKKIVLGCVIMTFISLFFLDISILPPTYTAEKSYSYNEVKITWNRYLQFEYSNLTIPPPSYINVDNEIRKDFHIPALGKLCNNTNWRNISFYCGTYAMGAFNARNRVQQCIRAAVAGGFDLYLPGLKMRHPNLKVGGRIEAHPRGFDYLFDSDYLRFVMNLNCPQMKIKDGSPLNANRILIPEEVPYHGTPQEWTETIDRAIKNANRSSTLENYIQSPLRMFHFITTADDSDVALIWGRIIRFRRGMVDVADQIIKSFPNANKYGGIHMRFESDTRAFKNSYQEYNVTPDSFLDWSLEFMNPVLQSGDVVYVGVGDAKLAELAGRKIEEKGYKYMSKWSWATEKPRMAEYFNSLGFDAMGLIDYIILLRATSVTGTSISTFSKNFAYEREVFSFQTLGKNVAPNTFLIGDPKSYDGTVWY